MGKGVLEVTDANFKKEVLEETLPVVVDFWALWCGPCKAMSPVIEELAKEFEGRAKVGKLNVDENPAVTQSSSVLNIPTLIFYKNGGETDRMVGINPKAKIAKKIEGLL
ncbi:MAG: thioredoxin [Candidatus Omnitrophica bacterium]|nr:thioredoxin [Candidatus Omnitrophota bacterium]